VRIISEAKANGLIVTESNDISNRHDSKICEVKIKKNYRDK